MANQIFQHRSEIFKVGIILIIFFSAIIGFFNIAVLYWFGIPVLGLIAGIVTVWFSRESTKTKIFSTFLPLPIVLFSFFLFYALLPKAEAETILLPQNFRGQLAIIFDEPCGQSLIYENGRRIYPVPSNGILITNAKQTVGVIDRKFYSVDESGDKTELPEFHWSTFEEEHNDWHWTFSNTKLSKNLVGVFWAYSNRFSFIISNYSALEEQGRETIENNRTFFNKNVETALKQCRQTI